MARLRDLLRRWLKYNDVVGVQGLPTSEVDKLASDTKKALEVDVAQLSHAIDTVLKNRMRVYLQLPNAAGTSSSLAHREWLETTRRCVLDAVLGVID